VPRRFEEKKGEEETNGSCCMIDEGRPFGVALQGEASNRPLKLLGLRVLVVSVQGKIEPMSTAGRD